MRKNILIKFDLIRGSNRITCNRENKFNKISDRIKENMQVIINAVLASFFFIFYIGCDEGPCEE